jgi:DnaJ-class molecular chaperone
MIKVQVLTQCEHCNGAAFLPLGEAEDWQGHKYTRYVPCPKCEGSGNEPKWISLDVFATLLHQAQCPHGHTSHHGSMHFSAGEVWDDIQEVCDDCGAKLEGRTLDEVIQAEN